MIQNQYPLWRYLLVLAITVLGALYALPNLYGFDPALQISARRSAPVDSALQKTLTEAVSKAGAELKASEVSGGRLLLRFKDDASRSKAMTALREVVDTKQYLVAFNLASATPDWLRSLGGKPMYMGLDLRGGVHFLMQVDVEEVRKQIEDRFITELRAAFREKKVRFRAVSRAAGGGIDVTFLNAEAKKAAIDVINNDFRDLLLAEGPVSDEFPLKLTPKPAFVVEARKTAVKQNLTTLRNRINEFGVAEPVIQQQGDSRVVVQLPGVEDTAEAKKLIGATATLEFRMVDMAGDVKAATEGKVPPGSKLFQRRNDGPILLNRKVMLTGDAIVDASSGVEQQSGEPAVFITLDGKGARNFARSTREEIGKQMAVVFIEQVEGRRVEEVINATNWASAFRFQASITPTSHVNSLCFCVPARWPRRWKS